MCVSRWFDFLDNLDPNTHNFAKDWTTYWARRIEVYFNKDLRNIIWRIGSKHDFKVQKSDRLNGDAAADRNRTILNKKPKRVIEIYGNFFWILILYECD